MRQYLPCEQTNGLLKINIFVRYCELSEELVQLEIFIYENNHSDHLIKAAVLSVVYSNCICKHYIWLNSEHIIWQSSRLANERIFGRKEKVMRASAW